MRAFLPMFLIFCIYALVSRYVWMCPIRAYCDDKDKTTLVDNIKDKVNDVIPANLSLLDGRKALLKGYDHFNFIPDSTQLTLSDNNHKFLDDLVGYFNENPDQDLRVTGGYLKAEGEPIGLARANSIRQGLVEKGMNGDRIAVMAKLMKNLKNPLGFSIIKKDTPIAVAETGPMELPDAYFASNSARFKSDADFESFAKELKKYMDENPDKMVTITGHTDDIGPERPNQQLGLERAQAVRTALYKLGVDKNRLTTDSKGETSPAYENSSSSNRAKNRRVEMNLVAK